jgi:hypothetical protein
MSRSRFLILITSMRRSPAMHRLAIILPLVMAATTAEAPLAQSSKIAVSSGVPAPKKPETPTNWTTEPRPMPPEISLLHSTPDDWLNDSPAAQRDPLDNSPLQPWPDSPPPAPSDPAVAITNDPPTDQPLTQPDATGVDDGGLVSRAFDDPIVDNSGSDSPVDDPTAGSNGGNGGTPSVGSSTAVPEPSSVMLLPAVLILMRRRKA